MAARSLEAVNKPKKGFFAPSEAERRQVPKDELWYNTRAVGAYVNDDTHPEPERRMKAEKSWGVPVRGED